MKKILSMTALICSMMLFCQDQILSGELFRGKIGNDLNVTLFLSVLENGCPNIYATAMYRYDKNPEKEWILLEPTINYTKHQYTLVEHYNTGVLILTKKSGVLEGIWISPDGKTQHKVQLQKVKINSRQLKDYQDIQENVNYQANDC